MDALDEFFATWSEPEAWCEMCGEHPAIHVVLRDTEGKYGGIMSHVRVWNPATQSRIPVCRQCCKDQVELLGQSVKHAESLNQAEVSDPLPPSRAFCLAPPDWLNRLIEQSQQLLRHCLHQFRSPPR